LLAAGAALAVSSETVRFTSSPAPVPLRDRVHPLLSFTSPPESFRTRPAPCSRSERLPWGSCSPSRHRLEESTCERASQARPTIRPRRFSRPRRFTPPRASRVYFTPQPRPGFTFQGFSPATQPVRLVGDPYPPVVSRPSPAAELPRLLQSGRYAFRVFLRVSDPRPPPECLAPPTPRSPPRFQAPSGFSPDALPTPSRPLRS